MTRVKICGIMNLNDALDAVKAGADALGFNFYKKSPRYIGPFKARKIIQALPPFVTPVGLFVDQKEGAVKQILEHCGIRTAQFHGDETPTYCKRFKQKYTVIKAFRVSEKFDMNQIKSYDVDAILLDAYHKDLKGGTGTTFDWAVARRVRALNIPLILSGGLHYNNVAEAIDAVKPYAVDVASGVEVQDQPGKKVARSMTLFCQASS